MSRKKGEIVVPTKPVSRATEITHFTFKSYDKNAGLLQFQIKNQDGRPTDLFGATVRLLMFIYSGDEKKEFPIFDHQIITESYIEGIVKYPIPNMLLSYEGKVDANIYIDFPDGSHTDNLAFTFTIEKSVIDWDIQLNGEYYFKDFQQLLEQVKAESAGVIEELLGDVKEVVDHANEQIVTMNEEVEKLVDKVNETSQQVENLGRLKRMYSNSIDFGDYDYSGNPNLFYNPNQITVSGSATSQTTPPTYFKDMGDYIEIDTRTLAEGADTIAYIPLTPRHLLGERYTYTVEMRSLDIPMTNIRVRPVYTTASGVVSAIFNSVSTSVTTEWTKYSTTTAPINADMVNSQMQAIQFYMPPTSTRGVVQIKKTIKVERGLTATPHQPNLLLAPYEMSKVAINPNLARNGMAPIANSNYLVNTYPLLESVEQGESITITLRGTKIGTNNFRLFMAVFNSQGSVMSNEFLGDMTSVDGLPDTWKLTIPSYRWDNTGLEQRLRVYQGTSSENIGSATITWCKIERGLVATPPITFYKYFGESLRDSNNPNDYSWDITEEYIERRMADHIDASEKEQEKLFLTKTEASTSLMDLTTPQTVSALKKFNGGLLSNGINVGVEYAEAITTDKYDNHGAVYLGGCVWLTWETLEFSNVNGWPKGSTIRLGNDNNPGFTYPDVPNIFGGYIWIGGSCLPDYTDSGFGSYHITVENNFDDARKPIVRFIDSPTTTVKKLAVRGFALVFAPAPTTNSKVEEN